MKTLIAEAKDVKPNDCMIIAGISVRVRYCHYHHSDIDPIEGKVLFDLQRFEDELHPLCDMTFMQISMGMSEELEVVRK
ncbi:hypothetical protein [Providencia rettgeri]|uniref:hypothetical protein n=1 Tax=Providencia rettgeri TaxID=587 RepID=UPI00301814DD